jgi:hypothetical protein
MMASAPMNGGNEVMKVDPFGVLFAYGAVGVASIERGYDLEFIAALLTGGFLALCFSLWKSRQRKADGIDTSLWAMIALVGTMALAFFLAPSLDGKSIPIVGITLTKPLAAFLIATGGTPFIEWLLTGEAFAWVRKWGDKLTGKGGVA